MSLRATTWAWAARAGSPTAKLVLFALAEHADEVGMCWPSVARLRAGTELSERAIRTALRDLEAAGLIATEARDGQVSRYRLAIASGPVPRQDAPGSSGMTPASPAGVTPAPAAGVADPTPAPAAGEGGISCRGGGHDVPGTPAPAAPEPSRTVSEPSVNREREAPRGSRLPRDWWPVGTDQAFARDLGLDPEAVADTFRDYWHGQSGQRATKADWSATWRNWCRRDAERRPQQRAPSQSKLSWMIEPEAMP